jgi:hypothetical protein
MALAEIQEELLDIKRELDRLESEVLPKKRSTRFAIASPLLNGTSASTKRSPPSQSNACQRWCATSGARRLVSLVAGP